MTRVKVRRAAKGEKQPKKKKGEKKGKQGAKNFDFLHLEDEVFFAAASHSYTYPIKDEQNEGRFLRLVMLIPAERLHAAAKSQGKGKGERMPVAAEALDKLVLEHLPGGSRGGNGGRMNA